MENIFPTTPYGENSPLSFYVMGAHNSPMYNDC